ncbi:MAG TPA: hypothetical protein VGR28_11045 [Candidatus Thermoplasmatota archaeon]|nr:hypothetical protein [Candidatus Thermoplasmatota archaeon]
MATAARTSAGDTRSEFAQGLYTGNANAFETAAHHVRNLALWANGFMWWSEDPRVELLDLAVGVSQ